MANFNFPDRIVDDPSPPSLQCTELGFGAIDLNADPDCGSGGDDLCSPSPRCMELGSGAIAGTIDLNVDPGYGSPPRCVKLGFGASAGIIDLNMDPDCGSRVGDPCPPSLQCTELGFAAGAGIIDLNVDPDCGSLPRARFSIVEALEVGKIDSYFGSEEFSRALSGFAALQPISMALPFDHSTTRDEEEECRTPIDRESRLAFEVTSCPPAPKKPPRAPSCKRRLLELELVSVRLEEIESWLRSKECGAKRPRQPQSGSF
ncbi:uncharacterized protein LOC109711649 [Ananas comosus]|uniref:Uncharacterized protein LOC109711649 n=1 Tax=Ananas comosus TaxID=4615 RepID=A0A6P5F2M6_ANACO|nr:uncharacterized protein LOC109711649 [Ananas comosus]